ncbi:DUF998 domain-containing protein [Corynebacterium sp. A21]|uniref:DUF998 domain-containing protein n=1 Tax=Corynebacterium sp. A21 TaxID=3457318 RepID=UPI003FD575A7
MSRLRLAGSLMVFAILLAYLGQFLAMYFWEGFFVLESNPISDLSVATCAAFTDGYADRYLCSPGHLWFSIGAVLGGVLLLLAAVILILGLGDARGKSLPGGRTLGLTLTVAALSLIVLGAVSYDAQVSVHTSAWMVMMVALWAAMVGALWSSIRVARQVGEPQPEVTPLLSRSLVLLSVLLLTISVVGFLLLRTAPDTAPLGIYYRLAFDPLLLWIITLGAGLLGQGAPRRRQVSDRDNARRQAQAERDSALRKAAQQ